MVEYDNRHSHNVLMIELAISSILPGSTGSSRFSEVMNFPSSPAFSPLGMKRIWLISNAAFDCSGKSGCAKDKNCLIRAGTSPTIPVADTSFTTSFIKNKCQK